jgi:hypothetical protein
MRGVATRVAVVLIGVLAAAKQDANRRATLGCIGGGTSPRLRAADDGRQAIRLLGKVMAASRRTERSAS